MRLLIEFEAADGSHHRLGTFTPDPREAETISAVLQRHADPLSAIEHLPPGLLKDALLIMRDEGHRVMVTFLPDSDA